MPPSETTARTVRPRSGARPPENRYPERPLVHPAAWVPKTRSLPHPDRQHLTNIGPRGPLWRSPRRKTRARVQGRRSPRTTQAPIRTRPQAPRVGTSRTGAPPRRRYALRSPDPSAAPDVSSLDHQRSLPTGSVPGGATSIGRGSQRRCFCSPTPSPSRMIFRLASISWSSASCGNSAVQFRPGRDLMETHRPSKRSCARTPSLCRVLRCLTDRTTYDMDDLRSDVRVL